MIRSRCSLPRTLGRKSSPDRFSQTLNSVRTINDPPFSLVSASRFSSASAVSFHRWSRPTSDSPAVRPLPTFRQRSRRWGISSRHTCLSLVPRPPGSLPALGCSVFSHRSMDFRVQLSRPLMATEARTRYFQLETTNSRFRSCYSKKRKISDCYYQCLPVNNGVLVYFSFFFSFHSADRCVNIALIL